jgi:hypothetical protein
MLVEQTQQNLAAKKRLHPKNKKRIAVRATIPKKAIKVRVAETVVVTPHVGVPQQVLVQYYR